VDCLTSQRRLKNRLVFFCNAFGEAKTGLMLNKTDAVLKNAKPFQRSQILYLKVAACLFQRIAAREQFPVTLGLKLDDHCGFSSSGHVNENEEEGKEN